MGFSALRFWIFFRSVFRFLCHKTSVFRFWCSFRFADFSFFSIRFSVFVEVPCGFSVLLCDVVFRFSYFVLLAVFGFARIFMRFCGFGVIFFLVLRFLIYPNTPLTQGFES